MRKYYRQIARERLRAMGARHINRHLCRLWRDVLWGELAKAYTAMAKGQRRKKTIVPNV